MTSSVVTNKLPEGKTDEGNNRGQMVGGMAVRPMKYGEQNIKNFLSGVGFEPTLSRENQSLNLAP